jgi:hypothetical protein
MPFWSHLLVFPFLKGKKTECNILEKKPEYSEEARIIPKIFGGQIPEYSQPPPKKKVRRDH